MKKKAKHQKTTDTTSQPQQGKPTKKVIKCHQNPFEYFNKSPTFPHQNIPKQPPQQEWIKPKQSSLLTIKIADYQKINRYTSHKSIAKYIQYLSINNCNNPMWLTIQRKSQVKHLVFVDVQIENYVFYQCFNNKGGNYLDSSSAMNFIGKFNKPQLKAIFKESAFLKESVDLWDALLLYDNCQSKNQVSAQIEKLPQNLTQDLLKLYQTYTLTSDQRLYNLYPMPQLPIYKQYYRSSQILNIPLKNKILVIDCQMVICGSSYQLARVSIINFQGELIYDQFFIPDAQITNYNTQFSGITKQILANVQKKIQDLHQDVKNIIDKNTILIGHSLQNDLNAMKILHQKVIDTSVLFMRKNGSKMKLKTLAYNYLKRQIQINSHSSSQDCKATLDLSRYKIQISNKKANNQNKIYHLLNQLIQYNKNVVIIDSDLEFIKHRKQYFDVQFQEIEFKEQNQQMYINMFQKHLNGNKIADVILAKIRKISQGQQWQKYYKRIDRTLQKIYMKSPSNSIFFINFQINNSIQIYPQDNVNVLERRRPFCLIFVKNQ